MFNHHPIPNPLGAPEMLETLPCTCGTPGRVHAPTCAQVASEFLVEPTQEYNARMRDTRRAFLRKIMVGGAAAATLPLLSEEAHADLFKPSVADQKKLGQQAAAQVLQKYPEVKDSRAQEFNRVGQKLVSGLPSQDQGKWDYSFRVVDSKEINAFALPGGPMFMFTGLMDRIRSSSELAAVTGHEMTHVRKEHWAKAQAGQQKRQLGLAAILGLTHAGQGWQTVAGLGNSLYTLKFSRSEEDQADQGGLENMASANFKLEGMIALFETLQAASGGKSSGPGFLSDHPLTADRIKKARERIARMESSGGQG